MMVGAVAPNFAESVQAVALGASGVQSLPAGGQPEKLRSRDTRPRGVAGRGIPVPSSRLSSPRPRIVRDRTRVCRASVRLPLRHRLHSSWAQLRLTGRVSWGRGDPAQHS